MYFNYPIFTLVKKFSGVISESMPRKIPKNGGPTICDSPRCAARFEPKDGQKRTRQALAAAPNRFLKDPVLRDRLGEAWGGFQRPERHKWVGLLR